MGAMLSRMICKERKSAKPPRKHANFAKPACFRGDSLYFMILQVPRESMAPMAELRSASVCRSSFLGLLFLLLPLFLRGRLRRLAQFQLHGEQPIGDTGVVLVHPADFQLNDRSRPS